MATKAGRTQAEQDAADLATAKALEEATALAESNYANLPETPEPMTMRVVAKDPEQGEFVIINTSDFNPDRHTPFDDEATQQAARHLAHRRVLRLRKRLL